MTAETLLLDMAARGIILIPVGDRLDIEAPDDLLTDDLLDTLRAHKPELLALLTRPGVCPQCGEPANLQDKARDAWFCPNCRTWCDGQGQPLPKPERVRPLTLEGQQAGKLIEDLRAAGIGFIDDDGELRLTNLGRVTNGLLSRLDAAGAEFRALAREEAERQAQEWEVSNEWTH